MPSILITQWDARRKCPRHPASILLKLIIFFEDAVIKLFRVGLWKNKEMVGFDELAGILALGSFH